MFVTFSLLFLIASTYAQSKKNIDSLSVIERDFQFQLFENRYFDIPSLINHENIYKYTYGEGRFLYSEGSLRHPQDYKKQNGVYLETASLADLKNTNWTLYGSLEYLNTRKEDVENNLTYGVKDYGSPYYFFQQTSGLWNHQNYNFKVAGANKVNSKLTLGAYLNYDTNFYFRKNDTRNELTALKILGKLSASYQFNDKHLFSVVLSNEFYKANSELSNKFPENNTELTADYYLNTGLGSYIKNLDRGFDTKRSVPEVQLQWFLTQDNWDLSIESDTKFGRERWIDKNIFKVEENDERTRYSFIDQEFTIFYNRYKANSLFSLNLNAAYLKGDGKVWDETSTVYAKNFTTTSYSLATGATLLFYNSFLNKVSLGVNYYNKEQFDLNYAYTFDYQYLEPQVTVGFNKVISKKAALFADVSSTYHYVLDVEHDPFAANNIFVDWIGNKIADYTGISTIDYSLKLGTDLRLRNKNSIELSISAGYLKVTELSKNSPNFYSKNDDYLNLTTGLKLHF
ncbi:hypothetical protein J8L85_11675 [Maribacter sp. MMG018]|uniref:DUF6850 family outer membrane beta-barrel protein n=1 Tax=Maribacter sp. MMG018 TaxID=2822688 RepID=UPI001B38B63B|nr:DUF6850 family outer membrane beta-barrel protein [Maribacter sp. MMG018]MBQ4915101.1 hypothetical protein [Maribacter sp. MMG018]